MEDKLRKLCDMLSDIGSFGIWVVDTNEDHIIFQNDKLSKMFNKKISSVSDMFPETERLLMHHNDKAEFNISIGEKRYKVKYEKLDDEHDVGMIRLAGHNEELINQLMDLKKEFKELVEEY